MNRADAPRAGWYPDPVKQDRLRWWDGSDWTDDRRVGPRPTDVTVRPDQVPAADRASGSVQPPTRPVDDPKQRLKSAARRTAAAARPTSSAGSALTGRDASAIVDEVRRATRGELDRATSRLTRQANDLRAQLGPLIEEYGRRFLRWARRLAIVGAILYVLYVLASAQIQTNLLEWVGDQVNELIGE